MENLLVNGTMTQFDYQKDKYGNQLNTVYKPEKWTGFWYGDMMEFKPVEQQFPGRIHTPPTAAQWFLKYKTPNGGIYQTVYGLVPGNLYQLTGWFQVWAVYKNGNDVPGSVEFRVDPYGDIDPDKGGNIVSQPVTRAHNKWVKANPIVFTAKSDMATVFIISIFGDPGEDMNVYVDDIVLEQIGGTDLTPGPGPGEDLKSLIEENRTLLLEIKEFLQKPWTIEK